MKKALFLFYLLAAGQCLHAQVREIDICFVIDSLCNDKNYSLYLNRNNIAIPAGEDVYDYLYDSLTYVNSRLQQDDRQKELFKWPARVRKETCSPTYKYLLSEKYFIGNEVPFAGWMDGFFRRHDSIMNRQILRKYGRDFFERSWQEAQLLDEKGLGLCLPYIKNDKDHTIAYIKRELSMVDTLKITSVSMIKSKVTAIEIFFKGNQVEHVIVRNRFFRRFDTMNGLDGLCTYITTRLNAMSWQGAVYQDRLVNCAVMADLINNTLYFMYPGM